MAQIIAGNKIYEECPMCQKLVKMTGWFARLHICLSPEDREEWRRRNGYQSDPIDAAEVQRSRSAK